VEGVLQVHKGVGVQFLAQQGARVGIGDGVDNAVDRSNPLKERFDFVLLGHVAKFNPEGRPFVGRDFRTPVEEEFLHGRIQHGVDHLAAMVRDRLPNGVGNGIRIEQTHDNIRRALRKHRNHPF
jgi:hypothetical protein